MGRFSGGFPTPRPSLASVARILMSFCKKLGYKERMSSKRISFVNRHGQRLDPRLAPHIESLRGVVTIGAPCHPSHVEKLFSNSLPTIEQTVKPRPGESSSPKKGQTTPRPSKPAPISGGRMSCPTKVAATKGRILMNYCSPRWGPARPLRFECMPNGKAGNRAGSR